MSSYEWNISEGSIVFWIRKGKLDWSDGLTHVLVNLSNEQGSIFLVRDSDNKLKFFYVVLGKGRTDTETDVSELNINLDYQIGITWSLKNREICLYIDGKIASKNTINYA